MFIHIKGEKLKILLLLIIIIGCTYIGYGFSNYYKVRLKFFKDFLNFLEFCKTQITFYHNKIDEIFLGFLEQNQCSKDLKKFLQKIKEQFISNKIINVELFILNSNEQKLLANFFNNLGKTNVEKQNELIEFNKFQIKSVLTDCEEKTQKFAPLATRLGFLLGLAIAICLI